MVQLASLLLLPLLAFSDEMAPERTLLIETVDEPEPEVPKYHSDENMKKKTENKLPTEQIFGNDYGRTWEKVGGKAAKHFCAGFSNSHCLTNSQF